MRNSILLAGLALACAVPATAKDRMTHNPNATNTETILHAWSWNFPTIAENMKNIADAGFSMVQTSPVQACYAPEGSGKKIFDDNVTEGNWYYYYQPTDWKIGNFIVGSRDQMKQMMDSAAKYNIKVIVDVAVAVVFFAVFFFVVFFFLSLIFTFFTLEYFPYTFFPLESLL